MKKARYIVLEGSEGVGKTTQAQKLVDYLRHRGNSVLLTKEPGTQLAPITMQLRNLMLDQQYESQLTVPARELISQAIRSIHMEKVVIPALSEFDYIVQDRGILSALSYGTACGNKEDDIAQLLRYVLPGLSYPLLYDDVVYLKGSIKEGLIRARAAKQEFAAGDAMESRGDTFMSTVAYSMNRFSKHFNTRVVLIDDRDIEEVFDEMLIVLNLKDGGK